MYKKLILTAAVIALGLTGYATAVTFTWVGVDSEEWHDPNNWNVGGVLPQAGVDTVMINGVEAPNYDPNITVVGQGAMDLYVGSNGTLNILAGVVDDWGLATNGSSYNKIDDGSLNVWGSYRMAQNLYVGCANSGGGDGVVNIYPGGWLQPNGVLTMTGWSGDSSEMNISGTLRLGGGARWNYSIGGRTPDGTVVRMYLGGLWRWSGDHVSNTTDQDNNVQNLIDRGLLVSGVTGYEVKSTYDGTNDWTDIYIERYLRAYSPVYSPALLNDGVNVNRVDMSTASGTIDLSWTKPMDSNDLTPVTSTVYFGTDNPPTTAIATDIAGNSVTGVAIDKLNDYFWQVDSTDPNTGVMTPGDVWAFDTQNVAPIASAEESPQRIWLVSGAASITLHGAMTDDGYPLPSPTYTYTWEQVDANDILPGPVSTQDVTLNFTAASTTSYRVTCSDGQDTGPAYTVEVRVFDTACEAGRDATGTTVGDLQSTPDCMVNFKDFALMAANWNVCKNYDSVCP